MGFPSVEELLDHFSAFSEYTGMKRHIAGNDAVATLALALALFLSAWILPRERSNEGEAYLREVCTRATVDQMAAESLGDLGIDV